MTDTQTDDGIRDLTPHELPRPGRFGEFGGRYVPEALVPALDQLDEARQKAAVDPEFQAELAHLHATYTGRPSIITEVPRFAAHCGGARVILKREDLNHTGSHKINNVLGQALLTKRMGKTRVIAETGAGQHGVATATVATLFGMECEVFMGAEDIRRQEPNVFRMRLLGAKVTPVTTGTSTLKDAMNEAMRQWVARVRDTFYVIGTAAGPHPYPQMVRDFQSVIGRETRRQILKKEGRFPDYLVACVGGGSNAMGLFYPFRRDKDVAMIGVEAGGRGIATGLHAASISAGTVGVLHGNKTYLLQDDHGQVRDAHSISAGLDYPGVGPEHSFFHAAGRAQYHSVTDAEALAAFRLLTTCEGIMPAMESAHALAYTMKLAPSLDREKIIVVCLSGRGDKDMGIVAAETEEVKRP